LSIITGANGTISTSFGKYLIIVLEKREIRELPKTAILGAAHKNPKVICNTKRDWTWEIALHVP
jgi:hypothetical protein